MVIVGKHINDVSINPLEYVLDVNGNVMQFPDEESAKSFMKDNGFTDDDVYWFVFETVDDMSEAIYCVDNNGKETL